MFNHTSFPRDQITSPSTEYHCTRLLRVLQKKKRKTCFSLKGAEGGYIKREQVSAEQSCNTLYSWKGISQAFHIIVFAFLGTRKRINSKTFKSILKTDMSLSTIVVILVFLTLHEGEWIVKYMFLFMSVFPCVGILTH